MSSDHTGFDLGGAAKPLLCRQDGRFKGDNLFIAARPDRAAAAAAQAIARDYRDLYRIDRQPLSDRRLHVSLIGLDRAPIIGKSMSFEAGAAIDMVRFQPLEITFDSVVSLRNGASRPIALASSNPNPALRSVLLRLADKLDGLGLRCELDPDVLTHMTLIHYDKPVMPDRLSTPISWMVDRLWLIRSLVGQCTHEFLWPTERHPDA